MAPASPPPPSARPSPAPADRRPADAKTATVRGASPAPIDPKRPLTLVFGGTFDPPHRGHIELPLRAARQLGATRLLFVPAGRSPFKLHHEQSPPADRLAMLRLALGDALKTAPEALAPTLEIDDTEANAGDGKPSYTVDTLRRLQAQRPDERFALLIGTDQLFLFPDWHQARELATLAPPAVMVRPPAGRPEAEAWLDSQAPQWLRERARLVDVCALDISSTELRAAIASGQAPADVCPAVLSHARAQRLYKA